MGQAISIIKLIAKKTNVSSNAGILLSNLGNIITKAVLR
jgi:hypothetical protein